MSNPISNISNQCYNTYMSPHNYEMKFNGSRKHIVREQDEFYSMFNGSNAKKAISFIPRFLGRAKGIFNRTNKHYDGAQKTPELLFKPSENWRDTETL